MQHLHDTIANTPLHNKYWVCGGALLGYVREGALLKHDPDIDFHVWRDDLPAFLDSVESLKQAGFKPWVIWRNIAGQITEYVYKYKGLHFEFFVADKVNGNTQSTLYDTVYIALEEFVFETPGCELDKFEFYNRTWLKPANHEEYLTALYGDWKTPDKKYKHNKSKTVVSRKEMPGKQIWKDGE